MRRKVTACLMNAPGTRIACAVTIDLGEEGLEMSNARPEDSSAASSGREAIRSSWPGSARRHD